MPMAPDNVPEWTWWGSLGAACILIFHRWIGKLTPWPLAQMLAESLTGPVMDRRLSPMHAKLDRICRVIDHMPDAEAAHAAVRAEDQKERFNWES